MRLFQILLLCLPLLLNAQIKDSLEIKMDELHFENDFEKSVLGSIKTQDPDYLKLFIASSGRGNDTIYSLARTELNRIISQLDPSRLEKYSSKKKIKKIFELLNDELYQKYELNNEFIQVFENGSYNCVSSSAINALVLEELEIPYEITELPEHVYVMALPAGEAIIMESTDPVTGYLPLTPKIQNAQIESLIAAKIITEEEAKSPQLGEILDELFPSESADIKKLLALQYYNKAMYSFDDEDYHKASENLKKSYFITPSIRSYSALYLAMTYVLMQREYENENYAGDFTFYFNMDTSKAHQTSLLEEYRLMIYKLIMEQEKNERMDELHLAITPEIESDSLRNNMEFYYYLLKSNYALKSGDFDKAYSNARKGMLRNNNHLEMISIFTASIGNMAAYGSASHSLDTLQSYYDRYKSLQDNRLYKILLAETLLASAQKELISNNYRSAEELIQKFEDIHSERDTKLASQELVGSVYSRLALHYFNQSRTKALSVIKKAEQYAPDNLDLMRTKALLR